DHRALPAPARHAAPRPVMADLPCRPADFAAVATNAWTESRWLLQHLKNEGQNGPLSRAVTGCAGGKPMRLICPSCGAQYEVDESVIPDGGRDVQCSNCGHAWFQRSAGQLRSEAEEAEARAGDMAGRAGPS